MRPPEQNRVYRRAPRRVKLHFQSTRAQEQNPAGANHTPCRILNAEKYVLGNKRYWR
jgi:hypothetical protein